MITPSNRNIILYHALYWLLLIVVFTLIWGTYDGEYKRNFFIQLWSLPARLIMTYVTLLFLQPTFLVKQKTLTFSVAWIAFLSVVVLLVQRPIIVFFVEGIHLPYQSDSFFSLVALVNTGIDVSIGTIPLLFFHHLQFVRGTTEGKESNVPDAYESGHLILKEGHQYHKVNFTDILFVESQRNLLVTQTETNEVKSYGNMASIESSLPQKHFLRIHRSYIVNLNKIEAFTSKSIKIGDHDLPVGRNFKKTALEAISATLQS